MQADETLHTTQSTVYDPMFQAFATLTPANTAARLAFHDVFETASLSQKLPSLEPPHHSNFMFVNQEPEYDYDVSVLRSRVEDGSISDPPTDDTEGEQEMSDVVRIWTGCYYLQMSVLPGRPDVGWIAGKGRTGEEPDLLLTTRLRPYGIRGRHAVFAFNPETRFLSIQKASRAANDIYVDGVPVIGQIAFNKSQARIRIAQLEYIFKYTEYARDQVFYDQRDQLLARIHGWTAAILPSVTPTPAPQAITVGEWTLSSSAGKGGFGKVSIASNTRNEIVAIKMMERNARSAPHIAQEVITLTKLTQLAKAHGEDRLVTLRGVIYQHGREQYTGPRIEEVSFILEPVVRRNLGELIRTWIADRKHADRHENEDSIYSVSSRLCLFYDALLGVRFLHENGWIHGDLKPDNIGIEPNFGDGAPLTGRAVLLDIGDAIPFKKGEKIEPKAGCGGTVNFLAPEREIHDYDELVDVWSMGVIGYELLNGKHPFRFAKNPWRRGLEFEGLRDYWHAKYDRAVDKLGDIEQQPPDPSDPNVAVVTSVCGLLRSMLRHGWASDREQRKPRVSIQEATSHPCWGGIASAGALEDEPPNKKVRVVGSG